jgi:hypothetical protein
MRAVEMETILLRADLLGRAVKLQRALKRQSACLWMLRNTMIIADFLQDNKHLSYCTAAKLSY